MAIIFHNSVYYTFIYLRVVRFPPIVEQPESHVNQNTRIRTFLRTWWHGDGGLIPLKEPPTQVARFEGALSCPVHHGPPCSTVMPDTIGILHGSNVCHPSPTLVNLCGLERTGSSIERVSCRTSCLFHLSISESKVNQPTLTDTVSVETIRTLGRSPRDKTCKNEETP